MIAEKPCWIRHDGMQIFSINIQPGGNRFATGGGDHKVRIWNLKSVGRVIENGDKSQRLLATLRDHFGSVNCVRWAKHGRFIASGSDDQVILIHERKPGTGTTEFGSGEVPDIENWKVVLTLRGHTADVVDLNWSPDDSLLASGSLDNTIHIWNTSNGMCTAVLRGHSSLVKGVAWDPIGSFIASQSDDKTVIIWRTSDWSLVHRTDGHWAKSLGSTFFRRLGWSPCGHFITTTHGYQKPRHSAPVLERGEWNASFDFLGHNAPVIVVQFNNSMFRRNQSNVSDGKVVYTGWTNGVSKNGGKELQPYNIIAIGSQDRTITVWTTASPRPIFVAKHFFSQSVVDLSWSPDGYSLFACSLDGSVATFHFEAKELGFQLTNSELDELKRSRYGDVKGRQTTLAECPAQLLLEAASAKQLSGKKDVCGIKKNQVPVKTSAELDVVEKDQTFNRSSIHNGIVASEEKVNKERASSTTGYSPVKQREYRRPDGRKRIIPEVVGKSAHECIVSDGAHTQVIDAPCSNDVTAADDGRSVIPVRKGSNAEFDMRERAGLTARAAITESLVVEKVLGTEHLMNLKASNSLTACSTIISIKVFDKIVGDDTEPICLEAHPKERNVSDLFGGSNTTLVKETEIICTKRFQNLWSDRISARVTVLAGNTNFWAVGCEDGSLQIYTKGGRRVLPTIMMGSSAVFIDCDENWKLLLVTRKGSLYLWDLFINKCLLHTTLDSLITSDMKATKDAGSIKVISAKLSKSGAPLVVLATRLAFLFDIDLMCWLRVADDCFPASCFASSWSLGSVQNSELAALQMDVRKFLARKPSWSRGTDDGVQTRAHLEVQLASTLAMKSPKEYRQCLLSYIRFLAREADESRLREVCESFLGPPSCPNPKSPAWDTTILGMEKRKLLREDILPAMAANRKVQRLLNEFIDLLTEYESAQQNPDYRDQPESVKPPAFREDPDRPSVNPMSDLQ